MSTIAKATTLNHDKRAELCLSLSLTALILSVPANLFPFMRLEFYGQGNDSTIWGGVQALYQSGELFVALVIFVASLVIPNLKIFALIYLSSRFMQPHTVTKRDLYLHRAVEVLGRWSMLDIFLVAILVAMMKFGHFGQVSIKSGAIYFLLVVITTMTVSEILARIPNKEIT